MPVVKRQKPYLDGIEFFSIRSKNKCIITVTFWCQQLPTAAISCQQLSQHTASVKYFQ